METKAHTHIRPEDLDPHPIFGEYISVYTRAQALEDGALVDVTETAREAGFKFPVAITQALHTRITPNALEKSFGQDYNGRLWDVVYMASLASRGLRGSVVSFWLYLAVEMKTTKARLKRIKVRLQAHCTPGDTPAPVITIGFPEDF